MNRMRITFILTLLLTAVACGSSTPKETTSELLSNSQQSRPPTAAERRAAIDMFRADGMMRILLDFFTSRGFVLSGEPAVFPSPGPRYCPTREKCTDAYEVVQTLTTASGETRTVQGFVNINRINEFATFFDRYNGTTQYPVPFVGVGRDQIASTFTGGDGGEPLVSLVNYAGQQTPGADSGASRRGRILTDGTTYWGNIYYYFGKHLTCVEGAGRPTHCTITFLNDVAYNYDSLLSETLVQRMQHAHLSPQAQADGSTLYEAFMLDCGSADRTAPRSSCWMIGRQD